MGTQGMRNLEKTAIKKIMSRIREIERRFLYAERTPVAEVEYAETMEHLSLAEAKGLRYKKCKPDRMWGRNWGTAWFRFRVRIPASFEGETVLLLYDLGTSECLIFRDGVPVQGLSGVRKEYVLIDQARGGEKIELYVEAGANARLGAFEPRPAGQPEIAVFNREVWEAYWDLSALADIIDPEVHYDWTGKPYHVLSEYDTRRARIIRALSEAVDLFDYRNPSRAELAEQARRVKTRLRPIYQCQASPSAQTLAAMGHAHIDVAWLWPLSETARKVGRTFSNVLELMDRYPDFVFVQSQPYLYECAKERYPALFKRAKKRIEEGRWIPAGCMWVESDCNIPSGESLVRQVLLGTRYFEREFGRGPDCLWLPDVFGFTAALPQILKRSGVSYFFTTKLALNEYNPFPYHSFHWEGLDGSEVLAHFMPAEEYSSKMEAWVIRMGEYEYAEKDRSTVQVIPFGHGDGGGGPAKEQLELLRRYRNLEGMPRVESMSPREFFQRLKKESNGFPRWVGELYLEHHRGTYTTRGRTKRNNRKAEFLLREAEFLSTLSMCHGDRYKHALLEEAWKLVLLNQFHDVLPGSSIDRVYEESDRQFEEVFRKAGEVRNHALLHISNRVNTAGSRSPVLVFNSLSWEHRGLIEDRIPKLPAGASLVAVSPDGEESPVQVGADGKARFLAEVPSLGYKVYHIRKGKAEGPSVTASKRGMENDRIRLSFDPKGRIRRIHDKQARREVLEPGQVGNRFILYEDKRVSGGDAWDIDIYYKDKPIEYDGRLQSVEVVEEGPVRSVVRFKRAISNSILMQDVILTAGSARIDFVTTVEWGDELNVLLKVAFPVNVRSERARYEIQFGSLERPTHWNTSYDFARFEVPAQKWADLSEGNYGVALLNDCKYGYDIKDNVLRLSLLRASQSPGKDADTHQTHPITYALLPHEGDFTNGVVRAGYELNALLTSVRAKPSAGGLPPCDSWMSVSAENVVVDTIKKAEDDDGIVIRLYEAHGWRGPCAVSLSFPFERVVETDLMEREIAEPSVRGGRVLLDFKPFEIRTLKLLRTG